MTTNAPTSVSDVESSIDYSALIEATRELATSMGIDAEPSRGSSWPIDVGQRSITADFSGASSGRIYLALVDDDVQRLLDDPDGAADVVRDLVAAVGISPDDVSTGPLRPSDDLPSVHVVARSGDRIVAFGVAIDPPALAGSADQPMASSFQPSPLSATGTSHGGAGTMGAPISLLSDVDMQVTVELGRTTLPVRELLSLQPGMVVELDRQAGEPIDVLVNGRLLARGEVVVLDEQFALRITEIISATTGGK